MSAHTGNHSVYELTSLTAGLKFFRYFPIMSSFDPTDHLECNLIVNDRALLDSLTTQLTARFESSHPNCSLTLTGDPDTNKIMFEIRNGDGGYDLLQPHFDAARSIEQELEQLADTSGFQLALPDGLDQYGFKP